MEYHDINAEQILIALQQAVESMPYKQILLDSLLAAVEDLHYEMPAFLQSPQGRAVFNTVVQRLVSEKMLTPVGKPNVRGLHQKYKINQKPGAKDSGLQAQMIRSIAPPAALDYYLKHPLDYINDRTIIEVLTAFLKQERPEPVTVNERAYQLFGDEKFFKGAGKNRSRGETVMKRLGLSYVSLACAEVVEPFFSFQQPDFNGSGSRDIYIIENKDTFWSFKRQVMDGASSLKVGMLIYGEGRKILSSFQFVQEYGINDEDDLIFYFGDLDAEGINIYCELVDKYPQYHIGPFVPGYQAVLEIGLSKAPVPTPAAQKIKPANIARFSSAFDLPWAEPMGKHLEGGFYIPQEALSAAEMKERFGKISDG